MPVTYTSVLNLAQIPVGTDGATANNERNSDMVKIDALFATAAFTAGSILFANASGKLTQDNANLFWDDTNNRLGIGTSSPSSLLHLSNLGGAAQLRISDTDGGETLVTMSTSSLFLDVSPNLISDPTRVNFFTNTFCSGEVSLRVFKGDGTAVVNSQLAGSGTCFLAANNGAVGIGTNAPNASAILDVTSTTQGLLFPRMTSTQRDAIGSPANGLVIFNTTTQKLQVRHSGTTWADLH